jgi:hypothetical protein
MILAGVDTHFLLLDYATRTVGTIAS